MIHIQLQDELLEMLKEKFQNHPIYRRLELNSHTSRVERAIIDIVKEDYVMVHRNEIDAMIKNAIAGLNNGR